MLLPRQALGELQLLVSNSLLGAFCFVQFARSIFGASISKMERNFQTSPGILIILHRYLIYIGYPTFFTGIALLVK